jgi:hypothetical protein
VLAGATAFAVWGVVAVGICRGVGRGLHADRHQGDPDTFEPHALVGGGCDVCLCFGGVLGDWRGLGLVASMVARPPPSELAPSIRGQQTIGK